MRQFMSCGRIGNGASSWSTLGATIEVVAPESCIGCKDCELHCPDFAIYVAERGEVKFAKLTDESKARAEAIKQNRFKKLSA